MGRPPIVVRLIKRVETFKENRFHLSLDFNVHVEDIGETGIHLSCAFSHSESRKSKDGRMDILVNNRNYTTIDWMRVLVSEISRLGLRTEDACFLLDLPDTEERGIFVGKADFEEHDEEEPE